MNAVNKKNKIIFHDKSSIDILLSYSSISLDNSFKLIQN